MSGEAKKTVVVLGAGVTGLSAAYRLSKNSGFDVHVVDKETTVGGVCRSFTEGDFLLDYGPHKFYTLIDGIVDELEKLMGDELLVRDKTQSLYMKGKYFAFPLKMSEMVLRFPPLTTAQVLMSFGKQMLQNQLTKETSTTYESFIIERFGKELYQQIFKPMAKKIYGEPQDLDRKLAEVRISSPGLISVVKQLLFRSKIDRTISAPTFHYPKLGYGRIPERLKEACLKQGVHFHLNSKIQSIVAKDGKVSQVVVEESSGQQTKLDCDSLIYTIPLSVLPDLISEPLPTDVRKACKFVSYRHGVIYYYLLKSTPVLPSMWVFFPESRFRFGRLSEMVKFSPHTAPPGHTALMVDFTCEEKDPYWSLDDKDLGEKLLAQMAPLKLFPANAIVKQFSKRFRNLYPVYSTGYQENLTSVRKLETLFNNLFFIGRLGDFNYNNADQCMDMGFKAADHIAELGGVAEGWQQLRSERFEKYKIVD